MLFTETAKFRLRNLLIAIPLLWITGICLCQVQEANNQASTMGELKLEGKYIERLVLWQRDSRTQRLDHPAETIKLPVGEYSLAEIHLIDGYSCRLLSSDRKITITNDKPVVLKRGAPLVPKVEVQRQGTVLVLKYELLGIGGEKYTSSDRSKPPTFAIYKGDKEIASDKFKFG